MRKFLAVFLFIFILSANFSFAYSVLSPTQTFSVPVLGTRQVDITVTSDVAETVTVNLVESKPWVTLSASQLALKPGVSQAVSVFISPFIDTNVGLYKISVLFESLGSKELKKSDVFVSIEKVNIVNLEKIVVAGNLEPLGSAKIGVYVRNLKTTTVNNVEVSANISSVSKNIGVVNKIITKMDPNEETVVYVDVYFDKLALPETYTVDAQVKYSDEMISSRQTFKITSKPVIQVKKETGPLLFGMRRKITVTNFGNVPGDETVTEPVSGFERAFFSGDEPTFKNGAYTWILSGVLPGETRVIQYTTDYTPVFLMIFVLIIAAWVYIKKMRTVRIKKYIVQKKKIEEGEEFTVAVEIKNSIGKEINAEVYDFVPSVFHIKEGTSLKPARKKSSIGTELKWNVKNLKRNEERVFFYKIISIFGISGTIKLPRASVVFEAYGKKVENRSFAHSIGLAEKDESESRFRKK